MIVWGGADTKPSPDTYPTDGGRYDPSSDTWTQTTIVGAPEPRWLHAAVWTGSEMIVWGGVREFTHSATGARYDPVADGWSPMSTLDAPSERYSLTAVWSGTEMIVWGGLFFFASDFQEALDTGGRYDPLSDTWSPTSTVGVAAARARHSAVWTGDLMIVWGGHSHVGMIAPGRHATGGRYDPISDSWTPTSLGDAAAGGHGHTSVWTGNYVIIFGGSSIGARYDPVLDAWTAISEIDAPVGSVGNGHTSVWTGTEMIVWGGPGYENTGGRYEPLSDTWAQTSTGGAPEGRREHTAVWTGTEMIVWGGDASGNVELDTGGRYRPSTDSWSPTSTAGAPSGRDYHTAAWTGSEMIVWGGFGDGNQRLQTGGRYDPATETWTATDTVTAPQGRHSHVAVWSGNTLIVWGGLGDGSQRLQTGGRYDPATDLWNSTSLTDVPAAGNGGGYTAVWANDEMLLWNGRVYGGRYDPLLDLWDPMSIAGAPFLGGNTTAVWTGTFMVVYAIGRGGRYALGHDVDNDGDGFSECAGDCNDGNPSVFPGAGEVCDGLDNDCDGVMDVGAGTFYYPDADGDGYGNADLPVQSCTQPPGHVTDNSDCNDADGTVWGTPTATQDLLFTDHTTLSWTAPAEPGGTMPVYDLLRSSDFSDFGTAATCIETDSPSTTSTDTAVPSLGGAFTYLPRAETDCPGGGQGSLGSSSDGTPRTGRTCP
jgi:N-acetylneuraminic acid mutarotase